MENNIEMKYACFKDTSEIGRKYCGEIFEVLRIEDINLSNLNNDYYNPDETKYVTLKASDGAEFYVYYNDLVLSDSIKYLENYIYLS